MSSTNFENLKEATMKDLRALKRDVSDMFFSLNTLNKELVTPIKFVSSQEALSQRMDQVHDSLSSKIDSFNYQL